MNEKNDAHVGYLDETVDFFLLNKPERKLIREILNITLNAEQGKRYIINRLGEEYIDIGTEFFKKMGG